MTGNALLADEAAIRKLVELYARAIDRNEPDVVARLFTQDAVIEGPGFVMDSPDKIRGIPGMVSQMYSSTLHVINNQTVTVSGDSAEAETYCFAHHLTDKGGGEASDYLWAIRYQDRFRRDNGQWRFSRRLLIIDWTETRPVKLKL